MYYIPNVIKPAADIYIADVYGGINLKKKKKKELFERRHWF